MDKEWIEDVLCKVCRHSVMTDAEWRTVVVDAIAQAVEEERATDTARIEALLSPDDDGCIACDAMYRERITALRAQVAVMADGLSQIRDTVGNIALYEREYDLDGAIIHMGDIAEQALSAAPKVLWSGLVHRLPDGGWQGDEGFLEVLYDQAHGDMQVIVLDCPRPPEQGQESEQCLPAGENSPNLANRRSDGKAAADRRT